MPLQHAMDLEAVFVLVVALAQVASIRRTGTSGPSLGLLVHGGCYGKQEAVGRGRKVSSEIIF